MINIAIIGLGHIGYYHLKSLEAISEFNLVAACDLDDNYKKLIPNSSIFYTNHLEMLQRDDIDVVIVATPNVTHFQLGKDVVENGKNLILEKPAATTLLEFSDLMGLMDTFPNKHIYYAFHAAKASEVQWFKKYLNDKKDRPSLKSFTSYFYDPYFEEGKIKQSALGLGNSWIDSGINALSVVSELSSLPQLCVQHQSFTHIGGVAIQGAVQFGWGTVDSDSNGFGCINTNWALKRNYKATWIHLRENAGSYLLDHSAQSVWDYSNAENPQLLVDLGKTGDRLLNHYLGVFKDYIACLLKGEFNQDLSSYMHQTILGINTI